MSQKIADSFDDLIAEQNKRPEFKKAYRLLDLRHELLKEIYDRRKELGWTQEQLAKEAGTHQANISRIESGELNVQIDTLSALAEALGTRIEIRLVPFFDEAEGAQFKPLTKVSGIAEPGEKYIVNAVSKSTIKV